MIANSCCIAPQTLTMNYLLFESVKIQKIWNIQKFLPIPQTGSALRIHKISRRTYLKKNVLIKG